MALVKSNSNINYPIPENLDELIGLKSTFKEIMKNIVRKSNANESAKFHFTGPPGVGKTTMVYFIAAQLGARVYEVNASDERTADQTKKIRELVSLTFPQPVIFLFDEIDSAGKPSEWEQILIETRHHTFITSNRKDKVPGRISKLCNEYKFRRLQKRWLIPHLKQLAEKRGITPTQKTWDKVTGDVRASIGVVLHGSDGYSSIGPFEIIQDIYEGRLTVSNAIIAKTFSKGYSYCRVDRLTGQLIPNFDFVLWLLENADRFFAGKDLYEFVDLMAKADKARNWNFIRHIEAKMPGKVDYPEAFREAKRIRQEISKQKAIDKEKEEGKVQKKKKGQKKTKKE